MVADKGNIGVGHALRADGSQPGEAYSPDRGRVSASSSAAVDRRVQRALRQIVAGLIAEGQSEPAILKEFFDRWVSPRRTATIADLHRGKNAGELRSETEPELLNDAIFGAIYYRLLLHSGPLTRRFGEELVEQVLRAQRRDGSRVSLTDPRLT